MKRFWILMLVLSFMGGGFAQEKMLDIDELMSDRSLYPQRLNQCQWMTTEEVLYVTPTDVMKYSLKKGQEQSICSISQLNAEIREKYPEKDSVKTIPYIQGITADYIFFRRDHSISVWSLKEQQLVRSVALHKIIENIDYNAQHSALCATQKNNLYVFEEGVKFAVTGDEDPGIVNGQVVHRNEFGIEKGTFWSHSGNQLAFYRMDETMVQEYPLLDYDVENGAVLRKIRYPEAGSETHKVTLGVYDRNTRTTQFLEKFHPEEDMYITGVTWSPDDRYIYTAQLDRAQKHLYIVRHEVAGGKIDAVIYEETHPKYVEPEAPLYFRPNHPDQFVWLSEKSGFNHAYLISTSGEVLKAITPAEEAWMITEIVGFSAKGDKLYFMGTKDSPLENNLYEVNIDKGGVRRITAQPGQHRIQMDASGKYFIDVYSNHEMASCTQIINNQGKVLKVLKEDRNPLKDYLMPETRVFTLKSADGVTDLYARMILPPHMDSTRKYPVLLYVYGGPHAQLITDSWLYGSNLFMQFLAQNGYIVFTVDSRGSANRGFEFESVIHRNCGVAEMADQLEGIKFLKSLPFVDEDRLAVDGWSYGGFMTLTLMLNNPGLFKVATAGGPVIDWRWYEIMYGERYMETPQSNPEGYKNTSLLNKVDQVSGKILVITGGIDPVVLPKHCLNFVEQCMKAGKQVDFFMYPTHLHNVLGLDRTHLFKKLYQYYQENL